MLERRPFFDPRHDTSTRTSVVRPVSNPQQVAVTEVDAPEFYNQGNDGQPSLVDPRWGLMHTQPAILRPDPMWAHRWPDVGPYRGMTPKPFSWDSAQIDGFGVTQGQRDRAQAILGRIGDLSEAIAQARAAASSEAALGRLSLIEGQLDRAHAMLLEGDDLQDEAADMMLDDVDFELDQVEERLEAYGVAPGRSSEGGMGVWPWVLGGAALAALWWYGSR